ncbi:MAG: hypothetical protein WCH34_17860 [Bacteroidota bacterium]
MKKLLFFVLLMTITAVKVKAQYTTLIHFKLYLEGLYIPNSNGYMQATLDYDFINQAYFYKWGPNIADSINIEIWDTSCNYIASYYAKLNTNGNCYVSINGIPYGNYYFGIITRNHLVTYSQIVPCSTATVNYNFSTAVTQAYKWSGGEDPQVEVESGIWAFYLGDIFGVVGGTNIYQDGLVDFDDYNVFEPDFLNNALGYLPSDFDGNGQVNINDSLLIAPRINAGNYAQYPCSYP